MTDIEIIEHLKPFLIQNVPSVTLGKLNDTGFYGEDKLIVHLKTRIDESSRLAFRDGTGYEEGRDAKHAEQVERIVPYANWFLVMKDYFEERGASVVLNPKTKNNFYTLTFTGHELSARTRAFQKFRSLCNAEKNPIILNTVQRTFQTNRCTVGATRKLSKTGFWLLSAEMLSGHPIFNADNMRAFLVKNKIKHSDKSSGRRWFNGYSTIVVDTECLA